VIAIGFPVINSAYGSLFEGTTAIGIAASVTDPNSSVTLAVASGAYTIVSNALMLTTPVDYDERSGGVQGKTIELTSTDGLGNMSTATVMIDKDPAGDDTAGPIRRQHNDSSIR
jgi:hypothetical protein